MNFTMAKLNKRKCKECQKVFQKEYSLQFVCSPSCAISLSRKQSKAKQEKLICQKVKEMKKGLEKKSDFVKILQAVFNTYIRIRDKDLPCISCGKSVVEEFHAGHFIPTTYQYHRFNEDNVNKQCSRCNTHLNGNLIEYRKGLAKKIGLDRVEYLENTKHMMFNLTIEDLKELIKTYRNKIKGL